MTRQEQLIARESQKKELRAKINAKCISCIYDEIGGSGTWRQQVEACTVKLCHLFTVRPKSVQTKA